MKNTKLTRIWMVVGATLAITAVGYTQFSQAIKVIGIGAAVQKFGPDIDRAFNKLVKRTKTEEQWTKVVPILSVGIGRSSAIGAVQVMGPKSQVEKVQGVAAPEAELFGKEIRIRAMIPVSNKNVNDRLDTVQGVGVSGIVDLKL